VTVAEDGIEWTVTSGGQDWRVAWHPPPDPPAGTNHGSAGVCTVGNQVVLVSDDATRWGLPGGRPEPGETWQDTLCREVLEEACATVTASWLLGYSRGVCTRGHEEGLVLVRAHWRAEVELNPWQPTFEMTHRRLVPLGEALASIWIPDGYAPMYRRIVAEALSPDRHQRTTPGPAGRMPRTRAGQA
jgi:8-oxo-dGTP pyrophosphatase MutT (NUDIX family)